MMSCFDESVKVRSELESHGKGITISVGNYSGYCVSFATTKRDSGIILSVPSPFLFSVFHCLFTYNNTLDGSPTVKCFAEVSPLEPSLLSSSPPHLLSSIAVLRLM